MAGKSRADLTQDEWDVVEHHMPYVYRLVKRMRLNWHDGKDAAQDGMIGLSRGVANCLAEKGCFTTIADSHVRAHMQRGRRRDRPIHVPEHIWFRPSHPLYLLAQRAIAASFEVVDEERHGHVSPRDHLEEAELQDAVASAMAALPERERHVIESRLRGETYQAIAFRLATNRSRIRDAERRAHAKLREMLADHA